MIVRDEAVVLYCTKFGETSCIYQVLTKQKGAMSLMVKGTRSNSSKRGSVLDTGAHLNIEYQFRENRDIQLLRSANAQTRRAWSDKSYDAIMLMKAGLGVVRSIMRPGYVNPALYDAVLQFLNIIYNRDSNLLVGYVYLLKSIADSMGIGVEVPIDTTGVWDFSAQNGTFRKLSEDEQRVAAVKISSDAIAVIHALASNQINSIFSTHGLMQAYDIYSSLVSYHLSTSVPYPLLR